MTINWNFVHQMEGARGAALTGYVPCDANGNAIGASGITIGFGIDLGQQNARSIAAWPSDVVALVKPYLGKRRADAVAALKEAPLHISVSQAAAIQSAIEHQWARLITMRYDNDSGKIVQDADFDKIPQSAQDVIASVTYQYGDPWADEKCGDFWHIACIQDWNWLANYLTDGFPDDRFKYRRSQESKHLRGSNA